MLDLLISLDYQEEQGFFVDREFYIQEHCFENKAIKYSFRYINGYGDGEGYGEGNGNGVVLSNSEFDCIFSDELNEGD